MPFRIRAARRAPNQTDPQQSIHFHLQADGRPYVCDFSPCESPSLSVDELASRQRYVQA